MTSNMIQKPINEFSLMTYEKSLEHKQGGKLETQYNDKERERRRVGGGIKANSLIIYTKIF